VVSEAAVDEAPEDGFSVATLLPTTKTGEARLIAEIERKLGVVRCRACRRPLTSFRSVLAGIGPVCRRRPGGAS
jgi:hypothetical protein